MVNVEGNFRIDNDTAWLLDEARPYYLLFCFILLYFKLYFFAFFYIIFGLCLIWEDYDEDRSETEHLNLLNRGTLSFYEQYGFLVVWEDLVDYLESIMEYPIILNKDLDKLNQFFYLMDEDLLSNYSINLSDNILLSDLIYDSNHTLSFIKGPISNSDIDVSKENKSKLISLDNKITNISLILFKSKSLNKRRKLKIKLDKLKNLRLSLTKNINKYKMDEMSSNVVSVGYYLNSGLYPVTLYDYDVIYYYGKNILYEEYLLFEYSYLSSDNYSTDNNLLFFEWVDYSLISFRSSL